MEDVTRYSANSNRSPWTGALAIRSRAVDDGPDAMGSGEDERTREWVDSASRGEEPAIEHLLEEFLPDLHAYVRRHAGRLAVARESSSDLVQSICRELLEHMGDGRFEFRGVGPFRKWLYRAALLKISARRRYHGAEQRDPARERGAGSPGADTSSASVPRAEAADPGRTPSAAAELNEELDRLLAVLDDLPPRYAEVLGLAQGDGLSHLEIANRLGISESHSRVLLARARARLASLVRRDEPGH